MKMCLDRTRPAVDSPRVLYASPVDISTPNGPGVNEREFTAALEKRFAGRVTFLIPRPRRPGAAEGLNDRRLFAQFKSRWLFLGTQGALCIALFTICRKVKPCLVIVRAGQFPVGLAVFAKFTSVPIVVKTQGDPTMKYLCAKPGWKGWVSRRLRAINLWAVQILSDRALSIDCCTPELIKRNVQALRVEPSKYQLVGNATNVERFTPASIPDARRKVGIPADAEVLGYVGGAPSERGGMQIVHAVRQLKDRRPRLIGAIVGGGRQEVEKLRRFASEAGVQDRCIIPGQVAYEDVPQWINGFDIGVAMDLTERGGYVGSSNQKIRQYLACGKPVIASAGVNAFLAENDLGSLVETDDLEGFVRLVDGLLVLGPIGRAACGRRARTYAVQHLSVSAALEARVRRWQSQGISI